MTLRPLAMILSMGLTFGGLSACSTLAQSSAPGQLDRQAQIMILPSINNTETPMAGERMDELAENLLHVIGVANVAREATSTSPDSDLHDRARQDQALLDAAKAHVPYALAISLDEWRYKVGLDGEPAVGMSLRIIDVAHHRVLWAGSYAGTGFGREAVSALAQRHLLHLLRCAYRPSQHFW